MQCRESKGAVRESARCWKECHREKNRNLKKNSKRWKGEKKKKGTQKKDGGRKKEYACTSKGKPHTKNSETGVKGKGSGAVRGGPMSKRDNLFFGLCSGGRRRKGFLGLKKAREGTKLKNCRRRKKKPVREESKRKISLRELLRGKKKRKRP